MNLRPRICVGFALGWALWLGAGGGCGSLRSDPPPAQPSADAMATAVVRTKAAQPFAVSCLIVEPGATVEWRNLSPSTALSVVSTKAPFELSSPALRDPYNLVAPEHSDECAVSGTQSCILAVPFSFWRHTFNVPGIFDYHDASGGVVTAQVSYEMPAGAATSGAAATGTVCVRPVGSAGCNHVCCTGSLPDECELGVTCVAGRCGGVSQ